MKKEKKNNECNSEGIPWTEFYRIVNKIEEAFAKTNLSAYESRIASAIRRKTFGFQKRTDHISQEQFEEMTGLDRRNNSKAIKSLVKRNIVMENKARGKGKINSYKFRKDTQNWDKGIHGKGVKIDTFRKGVKVDTFSDKNLDRKGIYKHTQKVSNTDGKRYLDRHLQIKQIKTNKDIDSIKIKNTSLDLREFLLKTKKQFLPNFKVIASFATYWDKFFQEEKKETYSFKIEDDLKLIKNLLREYNSLKDLQEAIRIYFRNSKYLEADFKIEDFYSWSHEGIKVMRNIEMRAKGKANQYGLNEADKKKLVKIKEEEEKTKYKKSEKLKDKDGEDDYFEEEESDEESEEENDD